ncbi:MAG: ATP-binding cassette domain-containing protein, partial [Bacillales bacterium]
MVLKVKHVKKRFGKQTVLKDITFSLEPKTCTALIGPNGAGKTTLLNMIAGDVQPSAGSVSIGVPVGRPSAFRFARAGVARTFQNIRVFPRMTVLENVVVAARQVEPNLAA